MKRLLSVLFVCGMAAGCQPIFQDYDRAVPQIRDYPVDIVVHVVTNRDQIPIHRPDVVGAWRPREIWVAASLRNGQLYLDPCVLGHEMLHDLHNQDAQIPDPDALIIWFQ
jgi:hypothetical protein